MIFAVAACLHVFERDWGCASTSPCAKGCTSASSLGPRLDVDACAKQLLGELQLEMGRRVGSEDLYLFTLRQHLHFFGPAERGGGSGDGITLSKRSELA